MGRDERPVMAPSRRRPTAADLWPEAAAAERQRLEAERQRTQTPRKSLADTESSPPSRTGTAEEELEHELDEPSPIERQKVRDALRSLRGG